jgi:hypothetical protein
VPHLGWLIAGFPPQRPRSGHVGFVVNEMALGQVFSVCFGFPCQFSFHQLLHTHLSSGAGTMNPLVAGVPRGLSLIPPHAIKKAQHNKELLNRCSGTCTDSLTVLRAGRPRGRSSSPGRVKNVLFSTSSNPVLGPTQPLIQWVAGIKRTGCEADHSPPTSAEVKKTWIYTSTPPYAFMAQSLIS